MNHWKANLMWDISRLPRNTNQSSLYQEATDDTNCVMPLPWLILSCLFLITVFFLSAGGNSLVCILVLRKRSLRMETSWFLLNLMACDFFSAIFAISVELIYIVGNEQWLLGKQGYFFAMGNFVCFLTMSFLNIIAVTLERFVAIKYPFKYQQWKSSRKILTIISSIWIYSISISILLSLTLDPNSLDFVIPDKYYYPFLTLHVLVPIAVVIVVYLNLLSIARQQARRIKATTRTVNVDSKNSRSVWQNLKAAKTVGLFFMLMVIAWLPFCVVQFVKFSHISYCSWNLADTLTVCVTYTNGALNVAVYWWSNEEFRRNVRKIICSNRSGENCHSTIVSPNPGPQNPSSTPRV